MSRYLSTVVGNMVSIPPSSHSFASCYSTCVPAFMLGILFTSCDVIGPTCVVGIPVTKPFANEVSPVGIIYGTCAPASILSIPTCVNVGPEGPTFHTRGRDGSFLSYVVKPCGVLGSLVVRCISASEGCAHYQLGVLE